MYKKLPEKDVEQDTQLDQQYHILKENTYND